jgi:hypothetical protein
VCCMQPNGTWTGALGDVYYGRAVTGVYSSGLILMKGYRNVDYSGRHLHGGFKHVPVRHRLLDAVYHHRSAWPLVQVV